MSEQRELIFDPGFESVEEGVLAEWVVAVGERFSKGDALAFIETYKASMEFEAPCDGTMLEHLVEEGDAVVVPAALARIETDEVSAVPVEPAAGSDAARPKLTPAAKRLLRDKGFSAADFVPTGNKDFYQECDVREWLEAKGVGSTEPAPAKPAGAAAVSAPSAAAAAPSGEGLAALLGALRASRAEMERFAALSSETKIAVLRGLGAEIGEDVELAPGALVIGARLSIGAGTVVGEGTIIVGNNVSLGRGCAFEHGSRWECNSIEVGDLFFCAAETRVGWGGEWGPRAELAIAERSFLGEQAMLNPGRGIYVGEETAIGAGTKIYTHQFWQSVLEGYSASHQPVHVGAGIQIGANAVILPGSTIGDGCTVAANSLVNGPVKANRLVGGVPARNMGQGPHPKPLEGEGRQRALLHVMRDFAAEYGLDIVENQEGWRIATRLGVVSGRSQPGQEGLVVSIGVEKPGGGVCALDLWAREFRGDRCDLSDLVREFLRKRGIRLTGDAWRYRYKLLEL